MLEIFIVKICRSRIHNAAIAFHPFAPSPRSLLGLGEIEKGIPRSQSTFLVAEMWKTVLGPIERK